VATFDYELKVQLPWTGDRRKALPILPELVNPTHRRWNSLAVDRVFDRNIKTTGRRVAVVLTDGRGQASELVTTNRLLDPVGAPFFRTF
jgi:hypothetical protein